MASCIIKADHNLCALALHPVSHTISDSELISNYKESGDLKHVGELYNRYAHLMSILCMKYLKNYDDSEDAMMEIFELLVDKLKKHEVLNFKSWLFTVTRNHCFRRLEIKKKSVATSDEMLEINPKLVESDGESDLQLEKEEQQVHLEQAIDELNKEQQQCIKLFYIDEYSYQEVTDKTGFTMKQVKSYIQNGKRNLKLALTNEYG